MSTKKLSFFLITFILWIAGTLSAQSEQTLPSGVALLTSIEGVTEYKLENGLRILLVPDPSKPTVTVNITYLVGSRHESYGETGMAHLLEHLMFKGTPAHSNIPDELSKHGAQPNGTTTVDRTNYFETFAATDENLDWALSLESDRMTNSFIAKKDLDSEMTVVRNEFENGENSPTRVLNERVMETAYLWHNYSHPTIGARSDIEKVPIEKLQAFYRTYYQPDNAVLIVAGNIDQKKTLALIQQKFGAIPQPTRLLAKPYTEEPTQDGEREVSLRRVGDVQAVIAAYHVPPAGHPDIVALDMLASILSDPASGRLRKRLVDTKLATSAGAFVSGLHDPGVMEFSATVPKNGDLRAAREELIKIAQGVSQEGVSEAELSRVRAQSSEGFEKLMMDANSLGMALSEAVANGDWRLLFWERDQTKRVTIQDIQHVAGQYLLPSNLTVGTFIPADKPVRAEIPSAPNYAERFKDYKGEATVSSGEQFEPTPANIESRTTRSSVGNIKLAFLPKKTRGSLVTAVIQVHFGDEKSLMNRSSSAALAATLLMSGTAKHDMQQLQDALTANKTEISANGADATGVTVSIQTDRVHLAAALRLAAEVLQQPAFPENDFDQFKRMLLTSMEGSRNDPNAIAKLALRRSLSPYPQGHVNYVATLGESMEKVKALTIQDVKKFYREFYGIGASEMSFVGDFDPKEVTGLVTELFADWKSPRAYSRVPELFKAVPGKTDSFNTPDKANAIFVAGANLAIRDDDPAFPALVLGNYMLGGGFLNSRLATRIRQKEGLSYGVKSDITASSMDAVGSFAAMAICAPQNHAKVVKAFQEELARALAEGFTEQELAAAKSGYLQSLKVARAEDDVLAYGLAQHLFVDRDLRFDQKYEEEIQALTPEQVRQVLRQFIDPTKLVFVSAGDFSKAGKGQPAKNTLAP